MRRPELDCPKCNLPGIIEIPCAAKDAQRIRCFVKEEHTHFRCGYCGHTWAVTPQEEA